MPTVLVIANPSDTPTRVGYFYLRKFSQHAARLGHRVIFQRTPTLQALRYALTKYDPSLVVANGHGGYKSLAVDNHIIIGVKSYDEATHRKLEKQNPEWFKNRIVLLLTCNAGRELAFRLVDYGAKAAIGFREPFIFMSDEQAPLEKDKLAEPFFKAILQTALHLVHGSTVYEACEATRKAFEHYRDTAIQAGEEEVAKYLHYDLQNLVCVGDTYEHI